MEVMGCDPFLSVQNALNLSGKVNLVKTREEIFQNCDYISVHVPLLDDTREMINKDTIAQMKDGVIILNFARDLLVCEADVIEALKSGKIRKYATESNVTMFTSLDTVKVLLDVLDETTLGISTIDA